MTLFSKTQNEQNKTINRSNSLWRTQDAEMPQSFPFQQSKGTILTLFVNPFAEYPSQKEIFCFRLKWSLSEVLTSINPVRTSMIFKEGLSGVPLSRVYSKSEWMFKSDLDTCTKIQMVKLDAVQSRVKLSRSKPRRTIYFMQFLED